MPICQEWNDNAAGCSRHNCCYAHICYRCVNLPSHIDRYHKTVSYPNKGKEPQSPSISPGTHLSTPLQAHPVDNLLQLLSITYYRLH